MICRKTEDARLPPIAIVSWKPMEIFYLIIEVKYMILYH